MSFYTTAGPVFSTEYLLRQKLKESKGRIAELEAETAGLRKSLEGADERCQWLALERKRLMENLQRALP